MGQLWALFLLVQQEFWKVKPTGCAQWGASDKKTVIKTGAALLRVTCQSLHPAWETTACENIGQLLRQSCGCSSTPLSSLLFMVIPWFFLGACKQVMQNLHLMLPLAHWGVLDKSLLNASFSLFVKYCKDWQCCFLNSVNGDEKAF